MAIEIEEINLDERIRQLLETGQTEQLRQLVGEEHPADLSEAFKHLDREERDRVFVLLEPTQAAEVLSECDEDLMLELMVALDEAALSKVVEELPPDDAADIVGELPEDRAELVLSHLAKEDSEDIRDLLQYEEDTAGGIMTPEVIAFPETMTIREVLYAFRGTWKPEKSTPGTQLPSEVALRAAYEMIREENVYSIFVVDKENRLKGFVRLQDLICARPSTQLSEILDEEVIYVYTDEDQEQVADMARKYDLVSIPVVDQDLRLVGRVTIDDLMDVVEEENTEDMMLMAGTSDDDLITRSAFRSTLLRLPWLLAALVGLLLSSVVYSFVDEQTALVAMIAPFIPVIGGISGNTGVQSATIVVQGLAMGQFRLEQYLSMAFKELRAGLLLGLVLGVVVALAVGFLKNDVQLAQVVGVAIMAAVTWASLLGVLVPTLMARLGRDPAIATGPMVTSLNDAMAAAIYILVAYALL